MFLKPSFSGDKEELVEEFKASISFDIQLYKYDIQGSIAHVKMLSKVGVFTPREARQLEQALKEIETEIESGKFTFKLHLEDVHLNIESRLIEKLGEVGRKLHTSRSRNDQVLVDLRLFLKAQIKELYILLRQLQFALVKIAERTLDVVMPGYTHLQPAQPVLMSHYFLAYFFALERDKNRLREVFKRVDVLPLGCCALAGSSYGIDREYLARELGFSQISENSIDTVGDRDFVIEFLSSAALIMLHLSRLCEELILWSSSEFSYIELPEAFCGGSSIMPQKKNPDVLELIRGKTGRVYGSLFSVLTTLKALPLAYNRDMQEDKEPLFDTLNTLKKSLKILALLLDELKINRAKIEEALKRGFITATEVADYLTKRGVPFRTAHELTREIVKYCLGMNKRLDELTLKEFRAFSPKFSSDIREAVNPKKSVNNKNSFGGTSPAQVKKTLQRVRQRLAKERWESSGKKRRLKRE
jgi:argininosuccinate lyase